MHHCDALYVQQVWLQSAFFRFEIPSYILPNSWTSLKTTSPWNIREWNHACWCETTAWEGMKSNVIEHGCEHLVSMYNNETAFEEQYRSSVSFLLRLNEWNAFPVSTYSKLLGIYRFKIDQMYRKEVLWLFISRWKLYLCIEIPPSYLETQSQHCSSQQRITNMEDVTECSRFIPVAWTNKINLGCQNKSYPYRPVKGILFRTTDERYEDQYEQKKWDMGLSATRTLCWLDEGCK